MRRSCGRADRLVGEQRPLHQVDQVRADIREGGALVGRIEEKRGPQVRHARDRLQQMMDALDLDTRLGLGAGDRGAEDRRVVHQRSLDDGGGLEALGHDVVRHQAGAVGQLERRFERGKLRGVNDPRLVGQHVEAGVERRADALHLIAAAAGDHHYVARPLGAHSPQRVVGAVDVEFPVGGVVGAGVEAFDALEVLVKVLPQRRVDIAAAGDAGKHFLLHQGGVEMRRIEGDELDFGGETHSNAAQPNYG